MQRNKKSKNAPVVVRVKDLYSCLLLLVWSASCYATLTEETGPQFGPLQNNPNLVNSNSQNVLHPGNALTTEASASRDNVVREEWHDINVLYLEHYTNVREPNSCFVSCVNSPPPNIGEKGHSFAVLPLFAPRPATKFSSKLWVMRAKPYTESSQDNTPRYDLTIVNVKGEKCSKGMALVPKSGKWKKFTTSCMRKRLVMFSKVNVIICAPKGGSVLKTETGPMVVYRNIGLKGVGGSHVDSEDDGYFRQANKFVQRIPSCDGNDEMDGMNDERDDLDLKIISMLVKSETNEASSFLLPVSGNKNYYFPIVDFERGQATTKGIVKLNMKRGAQNDVHNGPMILLLLSEEGELSSQRIGKGKEDSNNSGPMEGQRIIMGINVNDSATNTQPLAMPLGFKNKNMESFTIKQLKVEPLIGVFTGNKQINVRD